MIRIKPGVMIHESSFLLPEVTRMVWVAQLVAPLDYEVTITSGCDGIHKHTSKHYLGLAFDIRTRDFPGDPRVWADRIWKTLGSLYFVGYEKEKVHIHMQYNG